MAANACTAPSSYSTIPLSRSISLHNNQQLCNLSYKSQNVKIGLSFDYKKGFGILKPTTSPSPLRVSCLQNTKVTAVTTKSWEKLILSSDTPVLVEFHATWCGPCRMVHRVIDDIAAEYSGRLKCYLLDADRELQVAEDYDIKAVPVVLLFKNGEKCDTIIGTMPKEFYVAAIEKLLAS